MNTPFSKLLVLAGAFFLVVSACDEVPESTSGIEQTGTITRFEYQPSSIQFSSDTDGIKDTTISFDLSLSVGQSFDGLRANFEIFSSLQTEPVASGIFEPADPENPTSFTAEVSYPLNTVETQDLVFVATLNNPNSGFATGNVNIIGAINNPPEILEVDNPEQVTIPSPGEGPLVVLFEAKVTDAQGQASIDRVLLNFFDIDQEEFLLTTPVALLDNGVQSGVAFDLAAADSIFTTPFSINSSNNPDELEVLYWAIDNGGLSSDTVRTAFRIVRSN
ncbi:MAG: hypothetical protein AAFW89_12810 [Bacteroidota bacterium]